MAVKKENCSGQASPELLGATHKIAHKEGRHFQAVLEEAMREYVENRTGKEHRTSAMEHFRTSIEQNRHLGKLLSK